MPAKKAPFSMARMPINWGRASRRAIREYPPMRIPARPMGKFAWMTGSAVVASRGLTKNSAAMASSSASKRDEGILMTWLISRRS